ncbi:MAG TPA: TonB family protein, partial [Kofleriaceae bacterium]|nr:TonB family protein [Kofleriaceae bacterium]
APVPSGAPGHGSAPDREGIFAAVLPSVAAPPRRPEPVRKLPRARRPTPPIPRPAGGDLTAERAPEQSPAPLEEAAPPAAADGQGAGAAPDGPGAGLLGTGAGGGGTGGGNGDGTGDIDRSGPPVPIDPSAAATQLYTEAAMRDHVTGDVSLVLAVDPLGRVARATVRRGLGHGLDEIATGIAMQIKFRPARDRAGRPVAGTVRWRFHFEPPDAH